MILSLVRIAIFMTLVAALTFGVTWLADIGDEVRIAFGTQEFSLTPVAATIGVALFLLAAWLVLKLAGLLVAVVRFFNGDETALSRYFDRNRERRGFEALADGLMALASGEGRLAMTKAQKAERYLQRPELTLLISAQAAEMTGETKKAQGYYKELLKDDRTRFVGVHGIMKQKLSEGDTDTALKLAQKAFSLRPRHENTLNTLFALQSDKSDWKGARETLLAKLKAKTLPKDVHLRRDAVLALADARDKAEAGKISDSQIAAFEANRLSPDLIPAAVLAAEMHILGNAPKKAVAVLKKAWTAQPHPDLAAAFAEIVPDESPAERLKRFQPLLKLKPDDPETRLLAAELNIVAEDFAAARSALGDLADAAPTTRSLTIMAAIERGEGAPDNVVRGYLTKAIDARLGAQWVCSACHHIHGNWAPVCEHCAAFDTLSWQEAPETARSRRSSADMLPLLVGALDAPADMPPADGPEASASETGPAPSFLASAPPPPDAIIAKAEAASDDMDGILGDPHTIPEEVEKT